MPGKPRTKKQLFFAASGVVLIATVAVAALLLRQPVPRDGYTITPVITYSTDTPDETRPDASYSWKGEASDPKKIIMPSIGVDAFMQHVGVDQHEKIAVPNNIHMAGWFVKSARPGDKGLSIIDGHLNGRQVDGIFSGLEKVKSGDRFFVEFGDGTKRDFAVKTVQTVDLDTAAAILYSQDPGIGNQLNLITCGGDFDRAAWLYDKRVIVVSELIEKDHSR